MADRILQIFALALMMSVIQGAPPIGRVPTERWFIPQRTVTKLLLSTSTVIDITPASCLHRELPCDDLDRVKRVLRPSAVIHTSSSTRTVSEYTFGNEHVSELLTASSDSTWELLEEKPDYHKSSPSLPRHNWAFLGLDLDTTITKIVTVTETKRVLDPKNIITVTITGCTSPFDVPLCEEDIFLPSTTTTTAFSSIASAVNNNDTNVVMETNPLITEQVSVTPIQIEAEEISILKSKEKEETQSTMILDTDKKQYVEQSSGNVIIQKLNDGSSQMSQDHTTIDEVPEDNSHEVTDMTRNNPVAFDHTTLAVEAVTDNTLMKEEIDERKYNKANTEEEPDVGNNLFYDNNPTTDLPQVDTNNLNDSMEKSATEILLANTNDDEPFTTQEPSTTNDNDMFQFDTTEVPRQFKPELEFIETNLDLTTSQPDEHITTNENPTVRNVIIITEELATSTENIIETEATMAAVKRLLPNQSARVISVNEDSLKQIEGLQPGVLEE